MHYKTFPIENAAGAFGYLVECPDSGLRVRQETAPGVPGLVRMTQAEAEAAAQALIAEIQASMAEPAAGTE